MRVSNIKLGIAVPLTFHLVPSAFHDSFMAMEKPGDFTYHRPRRTSGDLAAIRNDLIEEALRSGDTRLLMLDTDQFYERDTLMRLLAHKVPVVAARVRRRYPPFDNLMFRGTAGAMQAVPKAECLSGKLVPVDATGTGCVLYDTAIFRQIPAPWFAFGTGSNGKPVGEDFTFCAKLRAAGIPIVVDTGVFVTHLTEIGVSDEFAELYERVKAAASARVAESGTTPHA